MSFRSEVIDGLRLCASVGSFVRLAWVEVEALVARFGSEGRGDRRARERLSHGLPRVQRLHAWLVRFLAERNYDLLRGLDVGIRYEVIAAWARRPGR